MNARTPANPTSPAPVIPEYPFVNELRLTGRQWVCVFALVALALLLTSPLWKRVERFETGTDYRVPYALSKDYWLYERWLARSDPQDSVVMIGDSVVWGEYVLANGTWSHFLSQQSGKTGKFINGGVNGLFPLAMQGLVDHHGNPLRNRRIILHCNPLWLSSPKADLQTDKEEKFNHVQLVPQFSPRIPCYRADANTRISAVVGQQIPFLGWVDHLQNAYFNQKSILSWTLQDDGNEPPHYPNSYLNPLAQITGTVPGPPVTDPQRGPESQRHQAWNASGNGPTQFEWVSLESSLQWQGFRNTLQILRERGNNVLVIVGPFNENLVARDNRAPFLKLRDGIAAWLKQNQIPHFVPEPLPSELYADASHPLTAGYELLAKQTLEDSEVIKWLGVR